jgi:hypothetical protein
MAFVITDRRRLPFDQWMATDTDREYFGSLANSAKNKERK